MLKETVFLILIFYALALIQTSFLVHLQIFGVILNVSLVLVVLINIFERQPGKLGIFSAVISGFFLDIFSTRPFGFWILILVLIAIFTKLIFRIYVRVPFIQRS